MTDPLMVATAESEIDTDREKVVVQVVFARVVSWGRFFFWLFELLIF